MPPIKINIEKNAAPFPRIPPRRMSAEKLKHLKEHTSTMLERGIIEELPDLSDAFINPAKSLSDEKKKKISEMEFPRDKKRSCHEGRVL